MPPPVPCTVANDSILQHYQILTKSLWCTNTRTQKSLSQLVKPKPHWIKHWNNCIMQVWNMKVKLWKWYAKLLFISTRRTKSWLLCWMIMSNTDTLICISGIYWSNVMYNIQNCTKCRKSEPDIKCLQTNKKKLCSCARIILPNNPINIFIIQHKSEKPTFWFGNVVTLQTSLIVHTNPYKDSHFNTYTMSLKVYITSIFSKPQQFW